MNQLSGSTMDSESEPWNLPSPRNPSLQWRRTLRRYPASAVLPRTYRYPAGKGRSRSLRIGRGYLQWQRLPGDLRGGHRRAAPPPRGGLAESSGAAGRVHPALARLGRVK